MHMGAKFCLNMARTPNNSFECTACAPHKTCHIFDRWVNMSPRKEYVEGNQPKVVQGGCVWFNERRDRILGATCSTAGD